jgi:hypothetical protein
MKSRKKMQILLGSERMKRKYMSYALYRLFWCIICCGHGGVMPGSRTKSSIKLTGIDVQSTACLDVC